MFVFVVSSAVGVLGDVVDVLVWRLLMPLLMLLSLSLSLLLMFILFLNVAAVGKPCYVCRR